MKFITVKGKCVTYKINIEKVEIINIYDDRIEFIFNDNQMYAVKEDCYNFEEVKEIIENL